MKYNDASQSVGLLWTSDQPLYLTTHNTQHRHPCPPRSSNPKSLHAGGRRPTPKSARLLGPAYRRKAISKYSQHSSHCTVNAKRVLQAQYCFIWVSNTESSALVKFRGISYVNSVSTSEGNYLLALRYTAVLIIPYPDHEGNNLMFLSEWPEFLSVSCLARKTWWQLASRCCWNCARPCHASELFASCLG